MSSPSNRAAFTLLELILVIVILGIVASIGSELIAKVYQNYIIQRAQHRASLKTELAALQIANRLAYAIPGTVFRSNESRSVIEDINDPMSLPGEQYTVIQWVGADMDSFNFYDSSNEKIGWSGFCDINVSSTSSIKTPGSELSAVNTIKANLGSTNHFAIFFPRDNTPYFGSGTTDTIALDNNTSHISEHYKMAWSSYALVVDGGDLYLYYNFSPVPATAIGGTKSLLMKNISTFKFKGAGRTIRFKICKEENIGEDFNITSCKEKAVF